MTTITTRAGKGAELTHTELDDNFTGVREAGNFLGGQLPVDVGVSATDRAEGVKSTGTYTPDPAQGNLQTATNGGAHTLAPPANSCSLVLHYTNNASAGAITTSGFTLVDGDALTTTDTEEFLLYITKISDVSRLTVVVLQ